MGWDGMGLYDTNKNDETWKVKISRELSTSRGGFGQNLTKRSTIHIIFMSETPSAVT